MGAVAQTGSWKVGQVRPPIDASAHLDDSLCIRNILLELLPLAIHHTQFFKRGARRLVHAHHKKLCAVHIYDCALIEVGHLVELRRVRLLHALSLKELAAQEPRIPGYMALYQHRRRHGPRSGEVVFLTGRR